MNPACWPPPAWGPTIPAWLNPASPALHIRLTPKTNQRKGLRESMMEQDMQQILFTQDQVAARVQELAAQITRDYAGKTPLVVGVLRGSFIFMADLVRHLDLPLTLDFMAASSYGAGTTSSGLVNIRLDLHDDIAGRDVLLVEDILDTGNTLSKLVAELKGRHPASLKLCVLLDKARAADTASGSRLCGFHHPRRLRGGLRPGLRPKIPPAAVHRGAETQRLRITAPAGPLPRHPAAEASPPQKGVTSF